MSETPRIEKSRGGIAVHGDLTIETAPQALKASEGVFDGSDIAIDLAGVRQCDSAALALMLEWQRLAMASGAAARFRNIPPRLVQLGQISELEKVLDLSGA